MAYSTILLDLDHTIFDSDTSESAAFAAAMATAGIADPEPFAAAYRRINMELWSAVERGETTPQFVRKHRFEQLVDEFRLDGDPATMADVFVDELANSGELYSGASDVLEQLCQRTALALVTNGLSEVQRSRIRRTGIERFFDAIVISAEVGVSKPAAGIFDITFERLENPARETALMVGDRLSSDIRGGANYGIATCWYNPARLTPDSREHIVHEIGELAEVLPLVANP
jgi:YjjG family noncanonical pyrimidine nucleotidase